MAALRGLGTSTQGDLKEMFTGDLNFNNLSVESCSFVPGVCVSSRPWRWHWQKASPLPLWIALAAAWFSLCILLTPLFQEASGKLKKISATCHCPVATHSLSCCTV
jgi:hypothetical protein